MIFTAILGPPPSYHPICAMTLCMSSGPRFWESHPRFLTHTIGAALIDYLAARTSRAAGPVSFGGHRALRSLAALMCVNGDEERAATVHRMLGLARDINIAHYAITGTNTTLAGLCPGGPGPRYTPRTPLGVVDWLVAPATLRDDLVQQVGCVAFLDRSCSVNGAIAFVAAGGTPARLNTWRSPGGIMSVAAAKHIIAQHRPFTK
jgi:hypothetical protein